MGAVAVEPDLVDTLESAFGEGLGEPAGSFGTFCNEQCT